MMEDKIVILTTCENAMHAGAVSKGVPTTN